MTTTTYDHLDNRTENPGGQRRDPTTPTKGGSVSQTLVFRYEEIRDCVRNIEENVLFLSKEYLE
jgi:hypothetical protein